MNSESKMRKLWEQIPDSKCRGMCQEACSAIAMSELELELLSGHRPIPFPRMQRMVETLAEQGQGYHCPMLMNGRCTAYEDRPTICRLYGSEAALPCEWGCEPEEGYLSHAEGQRILGESMDIGGGPAV